MLAFLESLLFAARSSNKPQISVSADFCDVIAMKGSSAPPIKSEKQLVCPQHAINAGFTESQAIFQENKNKYVCIN